MKLSDEIKQRVFREICVDTDSDGGQMISSWVEELQQKQIDALSNALDTLSQFQSRVDNPQ